MIRRCPQCGTASDDIYGFCYKCGREFSNSSPAEHACPLCGYQNPDEADYCVKCGTPLVFKNPAEQTTTSSWGPVVIERTVAKPSEIPKTKKTSNWVIIFGYIFSILGGLLGLIIAIYLSTRKDPNARKHGHIQLAIFGFYLVLILVFYMTGNIPADVMAQYKQILAGNFTSL